MPGYVQFRYDPKTESIPEHTKSFYNDNNIMAAPNIIIKNLIIFMTKIKLQFKILPLSVSKIIDDRAPLNNNLNVANQDIQDWYTEYSCANYIKTLSFKGPLLFRYISKHFKLDISNPKNSFKSIKNEIKFCILDLQKIDINNDNEWTHENLPLYNSPGIRHSERI